MLPKFKKYSAEGLEGAVVKKETSWFLQPHVGQPCFSCRLQEIWLQLAPKKEILLHT